MIADCSFKILFGVTVIILIIILCYLRTDIRIECHNGMLEWIHSPFGPNGDLDLKMDD